MTHANCSVCLEDLHTSRESLSVMSCGHITHRSVGKLANAVPIFSPLPSVIFLFMQIPVKVYNLFLVQNSENADFKFANNSPVLKLIFSALRLIKCFPFNRIELLELFST